MVDFNSNTLGGGTKESLTYPRDMTGEDFYPESIRFGIFTRQGPSYDKLKTDTKAFAKKVSGKAANLGKDDGGFLSNELSEFNSARKTTSNSEIPDEQKSQILDSVDSAITELKGQRIKAQTDEIVGDTETFFKSTFANVSQ